MPATCGLKVLIWTCASLLALRRMLDSLCTSKTSSDYEQLPARQQSRLQTKRLVPCQSRRPVKDLQLDHLTYTGIVSCNIDCKGMKIDNPNCAKTSEVGANDQRRALRTRSISIPCSSVSCRMQVRRYTQASANALRENCSRTRKGLHLGAKGCLTCACGIMVASR